MHNNVDYILNALEEFSGVFEINLIFHKKYVCHMFLLGIFLWWCRTPTALTIKINTWSKRETWLHSSNDNAWLRIPASWKKKTKKWRNKCPLILCVFVFFFAFTKSELFWLFLFVQNKLINNIFPVYFFSSFFFVLLFGWCKHFKWMNDFWFSYSLLFICFLSSHSR